MHVMEMKIKNRKKIVYNNILMADTEANQPSTRSSQ